VYKLSTKIFGVENNTLWNKALKLIKEQVTSGNFRTWFSQASLGSLTEKSLTLVVPSAFIKQQLALRYEKLIQATLQEVMGKDLTIHYEIDSAKSSKKAARIEEESLPLEMPTANRPIPHSNLNQKYTIENFVVGLTNNLAFAAAQAVIQNPGVAYNPLFIYGPSGVGKTHLMHAIGNSLYQKGGFLKSVYAPSERFMVDFVDSIRTKRTGEFRARYRNCDLLLIDDIQFISGKDSTQEEFFHTFNELYSKGAQIVLTSDRTPNEMQKIESRLMSRFQGGLMVDIQLPDFDTRLAILQAKLQESGETLPENCLSLIAESIVSNTRELEGTLVQILSRLKLTGQEVTLDSVKHFLGKQPSTQPTGLFDQKKVLNGINQFFSLHMSDLVGPRRQKEFVLPRQITMFILYNDYKLPMERIGQILGGRDHTTVLHGIEKIKEAIKRDRDIQRMVIEVKQSLT